MGEVRLEQRRFERLDGVGLPNEPLGLVGAEGRLDPPQVHPHPVRLGRLDGGHHVLVASEEDRVGDGAMAGQGLEIGADLGVDALLLAPLVEVAQA